MLPTKPGREEVISFQAPPLTMSLPFVGVPMDLEARRGTPLRRQRVFRNRSDPLALPENILYELCRFSPAGIRYFIVLAGPYVGNVTQRSCALNVAKQYGVAVLFARL